jgi:REase_DpnII-MboI
VGRYVDTGPSSEPVTGLCEVTLDGGVKISPQKKSFHSHGITQLHEALASSPDKVSLPEKSPKKDSASSPDAQTALHLEAVLRRFHVVARQLRRRHDDRATLTIDDEHHVQDLLHAILRGLFDDVRPEEEAPSYAGASWRIDFLLKDNRAVVETKVASAKLRDKVIGEQLIIGIRRYQTHPDCRRPVCLVYDPSVDVKNPEGPEKDPSGVHGNPEVRVMVAPQ